jgi:hypothetical protein
MIPVYASVFASVSVRALADFAAAEGFSAADLNGVEVFIAAEAFADAAVVPVASSFLTETILSRKENCPCLVQFELTGALFCSCRHEGQIAVHTIKVKGKYRCKP